MADTDIDERAERERLVFGAGFAFGVMFTLSILAVVVATVIPRPVPLPEHGFGLAGVTVFGDTDGE